MSAKRFGRAKIGQGGNFEIPQVDDGVYPASIKDVRDHVGEWDGQSFDQYIVEWELKNYLKEDGAPATLAQFVRIPDGLYEDPPVLNDKSNLYMLMSAIGYDMEEPEIEPDDWIGKRAQLVVKNKKIEKGQNAGQIRPRIETLLPLERRPAAQRGTSRPPGERPRQRRPANAESDW